MLSRGKSKERTSRKVTPPSPSYMNNDQFASYLAGLRENRVNRPGGARPQPVSSSQSCSQVSTGRPSMSGRPSIGGASFQTESRSNHERTQSDSGKVVGRPSLVGSVSSRYSTSTLQGRDYYPDRSSPMPLKASEVVPSATYIERGQRWMEKEEAFSLHQAMAAKDSVGSAGQTSQAQDADEARLYNTALNEAAELVWQHQNGVRSPEPGAPYRYRHHLRKNSYAHARTASSGRYGSDIGATGLARDGYRSASGSSTDSGGMPSATGSRYESLDQRPGSPVGAAWAKQYGSLSKGGYGINRRRRRSSIKRNISGEIEKPFSEDQIWEEPEGGSSTHVPYTDDATVQPLSLKTKNLANNTQQEPSAPLKTISRSEIHRNPPSQSRNPQYTSNKATERPQNVDRVQKKHGMEIRSEDIRQATSMRLADRSRKLPTPSAVSDSPGRPIVSFDANWKAPEESTDPKPEDFRPSSSRNSRSQEVQIPPVPSIAVSSDVQASTAPSRFPHGPSIPTIQVDCDDTPPVPVITIEDSTPTAPSIVLPGDGDEVRQIVPVIFTPDSTPASSKRPLPTPRATPSHLRNARGSVPRAHPYPAQTVGSRATARCHECGLPIEGRFVALRGTAERFHPQCFSCYACGTSLEALEISPEPEEFRGARLDRIRRRANGEILDEDLGKTMAEDGDERLRFYCHLDWHELFAPRCKHCKTPIMGDHVVALGQHWHYGHFFCAECGDPFEQGMTHIEKDGYAWCINCQTKRTERRAPKCKACKKAVIGQYIQALGGEWHEECFRCATCYGGFDDGQIFPREDGDGMAVLCTRCREMELKA